MSGRGEEVLSTCLEINKSLLDNFRDLPQELKKELEVIVDENKKELKNCNIKKIFRQKK